MATRIERLQESLKKERKKQDDKKLNDALSRINMAVIILNAHTFHSILYDRVDDIRSFLAEAQNSIKIAIDIQDSDNA
jgi:hypothetical protein